MSEPDWNEDVRESVADQLTNTLNNQITSRGEVERKAAQVIGADMIAASIIIGLSMDGSGSAFVALSLLAFVASIYFCLRIFVPKAITLGVGPGGASSSAGMDAGEYYDELISQLSSMITENASVKTGIAADLENAIRAAFAGVLFLLATYLSRFLGLQGWRWEVLGTVLVFLLVALTWLPADDNETTNSSD